MDHAITPDEPRQAGWSFGRLDAVLALLALALLATMAIPSHQGATTGARRQEVRAVAGSLEGAARFAHSIWQAQGAPTELRVRRGRVVMTHGYPAASSIALLLEESELMGFSVAAGTLQHRDARAACGVRYEPATQPGLEPAVTLVLDGC